MPDVNGNLTLTDILTVDPSTGQLTIHVPAGVTHQITGALKVTGTLTPSGTLAAAGITATSLGVTGGAIVQGSAAGVFSAAVSIPVTTANVIKVACTSNTASTFTPSGPGTAGQELTLIITADGTGGNVITFASTFKSSGTLTTTASKGHTVKWVSDGTNWWETARVTAL